MTNPKPDDRYLHVRREPKGNYTFVSAEQMKSQVAWREHSPEDLHRRFVEQGKAGMLCDWQIRQRCEAYGMLDPFVDHQVRERLVESMLMTERHPIISYGLTSMGYDVRLADAYKVFDNRRGGLIDPLAFDAEKLLRDERGPYCNIAPNSYILGHTVERFNLPSNIVADCVGKSTYARCGLLVNVTPAEPEWAGYLTLELCNGTPCPIRVYANMGIAQMRFYEGETPIVTYRSRAGKYQDQPAEPVNPRL